MSDDAATSPGDERRPRPAEHGARTSHAGTPVAVDVSGDVQTRKSLAMFVAGAVIWTVHFLVVYLVTEAGCSGDGQGFTLFDPPVPTTVTLVATVVAVLACVASAVWNLRRWRLHRAGHGPGSEPPHLGSLAFAGFLLSALGIVTVLLVGLPALVLPPC